MAGKNLFQGLSALGGVGGFLGNVASTAAQVAQKQQPRDKFSGSAPRPTYAEATSQQEEFRPLPLVQAATSAAKPVAQEPTLNAARVTAAEAVLRQLIENNQLATAPSAQYLNSVPDVLKERDYAADGVGSLDPKPSAPKDTPVTSPYAANAAQWDKMVRALAESGKAPAKDVSTEALIEMVDAQQARDARRVGLGMLPEAVQGPVAVLDNRAEEMSWDDYEALSPKMRTAVDINTALMNAVRKDMKLQERYAGATGKVAEKRQAEYDARIQKLFGENALARGRDSETYAPQTVALLDSLGYHDQDADLDDFLSLRAAVRAEDLAKIDSTPQGYQAADPTGSGKLLSSSKADNPSDRAEMFSHLVRGAEELKQKMADSRNMSMFSDQLRREIYDRGRNLGVDMKFRNLTPGLGADGDRKGSLSEGDLFFKKAFNSLANASDEDIKFTMANFDDTPFKAMGVSPDVFWTYADARIRNTEEFQPYGATLGKSAKGKSRTPEEFRALLGLERIEEK